MNGTSERERRDRFVDMPVGHGANMARLFARGLKQPCEAHRFYFSAGRNGLCVGSVSSDSVSFLILCK